MKHRFADVRYTWGRSLGVAFAAALLVTDTAFAQNAGRVTRESVDALGKQVSGDSGSPSLSADGRLVAFHSDAADLVPGDTNLDTDIFVRDRQTGVVQRESLTWNGMEARDDSICPALSADGRWLAFLSLAWNMYPGGANLGSPRWDVYLRDRQAGTTTRISVAAAGGDPNGDSLCPSISGDGSRVVFASFAANLVSGDENGTWDVFLFDRDVAGLALVSTAAAGGAADNASLDPVVSGDGEVIAFASRASDLVPPRPPDPVLVLNGGFWNVFVREVASGAIELASRAFLHPQFAPTKDSTRPALSADGRFVAFESSASNIVPVYPAGKVVYVYDRVTETTETAGVHDGTLHDCGPDGSSFCRHGTNHAPAISADGRFVAFSSGSARLLPANLADFGSDIYLFDRVGRRLRRISVDPTGWGGNSCSEDAALSADGKVVVYRTAAGNLVAGDTNWAEDVLSSDWTCADDGRCHDIAACPAEPAPDCAAPSESVLRLSKRPPGGVRDDSFFWRWTGEPSIESFPDPAGGHYQLCVYAKSLVMDVAAANGPSCTGSGRPCWKTLAGGYKLTDPKGGLTSLRVSVRDGAPRILARGDGRHLDAPYLPVAAPQGLIVQLQDTSSGRCWGVGFPLTAIKRNERGAVAVGSTRNGRLVARSR